jgi:hypothetical protein
MKYYILANWDGDSVALYRFNNSQEAFAQQIWMASTKAWADTEELGKYLIDGEVFLGEVTPEDAKSRFPDAFAVAEEEVPAEGQVTEGQ